MAKQGMKRPSRTHVKPKNDEAAVPEIQGKAKHKKVRANAVIAGTHAPNQKVYHTNPPLSAHKAEAPVPDIFPVLDTDLARDNLENDISAADLQDLR